MQDTGPVLQRLQLEAYRAVLRAMAFAPLQYQQEKLLNNLRKELCIDNTQHLEVLQELNSDVELNSIRDALSAQRDGHAAPAIDLDPQSSQRAAGAPQGAKRHDAHYAPASSAAGKGRPPSASRDALTAGVGASRMSGKRSTHGKHIAELMEVDIAGVPAPSLAPVPQRAPVARDASVDPYIGRHIMRFWPTEGRRWHKGIITDYDPGQGHCITYNKDAAGEAWEWVNFDKLRLGAETQNGYKWVDRAPSAIAAGGKRKRPDSECPVKLDLSGEVAYAPFHEATFRHQLPRLSVQDLSAMQQMLDWRASEIQHELMLLDAAEKPLDAASGLQCQLEALNAHEKALQSELQALAAY